MRTIVLLVVSFACAAGSQRFSKSHIDQWLKWAQERSPHEDRQNPPELSFQDIDGDWIRLTVEQGKINQYVNNELVRKSLSRFEINPRTRTYTDDNGNGNFMPHEDLHTLECMVGMLFRSDKAIEFQDADGDWIQLVVEDGLINEYVNGELAYYGLTRFEIDEKARTYTDDAGKGEFKAHENLPKLMHLIAILSHTEKEVVFRDGDGDRIRFMIENGHVNQYVNDEVVHQGLPRFEIDQETGIYYDDAGHGQILAEEDLPSLARSIAILFQSQAVRIPLNGPGDAPSSPDVDRDASSPSPPAPPPPPSVEPESDNLYSRLGLTPDASASAIKKAYRKVALLCHPDKNPDRYEEAQVMFRHVAEAYDVLSDPYKREAYDIAGIIYE